MKRICGAALLALALITAIAAQQYPCEQLGASPELCDVMRPRIATPIVLRAKPQPEPFDCLTSEEMFLLMPKYVFAIRSICMPQHELDEFRRLKARDILLAEMLKLTA